MRQQPTDPNLVQQAIVPLLTLLCPSDNPGENARLNYVVNCGPATEHMTLISEGAPSGGVARDFTPFRDRRHSLVFPAPAKNPRFSFTGNSDMNSGIAPADSTIPGMTQQYHLADGKCGCGLLASELGDT
jgi:hypothetical protein